MRTLGAIFLGIGAWFVYGAIFDWVLEKRGLALPDKDSEAGPSTAKRSRRRHLGDAERQMSRITKRGLPYGIASLFVGIVLLLLSR